MTAVEERKSAVSQVPADWDEHTLAEMSYGELSKLAGVTALGRTLVNKVELIGVPFIITRAIFYLPKPKQIGMMTCHARIADEQRLTRLIKAGRIFTAPDPEGDLHCVTTLDEMTIDPEEEVVFNDGSTGVRRTVVETLATQFGLLEVKAAEGDMKSAYDYPWTAWKTWDANNAGKQGDYDIPDFTRDKNGRPFILYCPRGMRRSVYDNESADNAVTFYLA